MAYAMMGVTIAGAVLTLIVLPALYVTRFRISHRSRTTPTRMNREPARAKMLPFRLFPREFTRKNHNTRWMPAKRLLPFANYVIHSAVVSRRTESWQRV